VAKAMTSDDLARARAAAKAWHVKSPIAEANAVSAPGGGWDGPGDMLGEADRQALVMKIQVLLAEQGFDPGPADGVAGPKTVEAVRAFQRETGQPDTGRIDNSLVASLADPT
jgi:localization factor PodJL